MRLYLIFVCVIKRMAFEAYNTITELDAYLRSLGLYVGEKLWFCCASFRKDFFVMMVYLVTVSVSVC